MKTFHEYCTLQQVAEYCEVTGETPEAVINEFLGWAKRMLGFGGQQPEQPEQMPIPRRTGSGVAGGTPNDQGLALYTRGQLNKFQGGTNKAQKIMMQLQTGFKQAVDQVRGGFGTNAGEFFNGVQGMVDRFLKDQLMPKIQVKLGDGERVGVRDTNANRQLSKYPPSRPNPVPPNAAGSPVIPPQRVGGPKLRMT